jgi:hypothetical protein
MPKGLDTMIGFVSSTAIVFNLGTYLLPTNISRAFTSIIQITPRYVDTPSLDFTMVGRCYANEVWVSCREAILEVARAGTLGYDQAKTEGYVRSMKPLIAAYSICKCSSFLRRGRLISSSRDVTRILLRLAGL